MKSIAINPLQIYIIFLIRQTFMQKKRAILKEMPSVNGDF